MTSRGFAVGGALLSVALALVFMGGFLVLSGGGSGLSGRVTCVLVGCVDSGVNLTAATVSGSTTDVSDALRFSENRGVILLSEQSMELDYADAFSSFPANDTLANVTLLVSWSLANAEPSVSPNASLSPIDSANVSVSPSVDVSVSPDANATVAPDIETGLNGSVAATADATFDASSNGSDSNGLLGNSGNVSVTNPVIDVNGSIGSNSSPVSPSNGSSSDSVPRGSPFDSVANDSALIVSVVPSATVVVSVSPSSDATATPTVVPAVSVSVSATPSPTPVDSAPSVPSASPSDGANLSAFSSMRFDDAPLETAVVSAFTGSDFETVCTVSISLTSVQDVECPLTSFFEKYPLLLAQPKFRVTFSSSDNATLLIDQARLVVSTVPNPSANESVNPVKVNSDARFDAVVDSADMEGDDLVVIFHHDAPVLQPIFVKGKVRYFLSQNESNAGQNVSLRIYDYSNQFFKLRIGNNSEVFEFGQAQDVAVQASVLDAQGQLQNASVVFSDSESHQTQLATTSATSASLEQGEYDVSVRMSDGGPVSNVTLVRASVFDSASSVLLLENLSDSESGLHALKSFAIAPGNVSFERGFFSATASGTRLLKCPSWDFDAKVCPGGWILVGNLSVGQSYDVNFTATDPAYAEINATAAEHFDANGQYVEDIFPSVSSKDGVFSSRIPVGHAVRVTYEHLLENGNVIDTYFRGTPTSRYDVYLAGTSTKVGQSGQASATASWQYVYMQTLAAPSELFDFVVVDDTDPSGYLEFDRIHDGPPPGISFVSPTPAEGASLPSSSVSYNVSVTNGADLANFIWNANGTNASFYDPSLVAFYNFDNVTVLGETATKAVDVSTNRNNGTFNGNVAWTSSGKYASALTFDGTGDYLSVTDADSLDLTSDLTISLWAKLNSLKDQGFFGRGTNGYLVYSYSSGKVALGKNGVDEVLSNAAISTGTWYHLAFTHAGGVSKVYINGVLDKSGNAADFAVLGSAVLIGTNPGDANGWSMNGILDEVRIWNRALTASEIAQQYRSNLNKESVGNWSLLATPPLTSGPYSAYAWVNDSLGQYNQTETRSLTLLPPNLYVSSSTSLGGGNFVYGNVTVTNGATLTVGGTAGTTLNVTGLLKLNGSSTLVLSGNYTTNSDGTGVNVTAGNVTVEGGSVISANGTGYAGGTDSVGAKGTGAGAGNWNGGGGGYGGWGGSGSANAGGTSYGSLTAPSDLGSGGAGGSGNRAGGAGAGAILLNVSGTLVLDGKILAIGASSIGSDCCNEGSGGSGGSIYVVTNVLSGSGNFSADGGTDPSGGAGGAGGAGGRVAVYYQSASGFTGFRNSTASGGAGTNQAGGEGTVGFFDTSVSNYHLKVFRQFRYETVNRTWTFGAITVDEGGRLDFSGNSTVAVTGNITVTGSSLLNASGSPRSGSSGKGVNFTAANLRIDSGSRFSADTQGYAGGTDGTGASGPGAGAGNWNGGGAGYGGRGGAGSAAAGGTKYGSWIAPLDLGSGGAGGSGARVGGNGGGAIFLNVSGTVTLNGELTSHGANSTGSDCCNEGSGGSGGSIYVVTNVLSGSGFLGANGGNDPSGGSGAAGGGGGRIAVYYQSASGFSGFTSASGAGGTGTNQNGFYGFVGFFDTSISNYHLSVFQHLSYDTPGASLSFGAITVNGSGMLNFSGDSVVAVTGNLTLNGNSVLNVSSSSNRGVNITAGNVTVATGARIISDYQGYAGGTDGVGASGPGAGSGNWNGGGGAFGGNGGAGASGAGGSAYGSLTAPSDLGSGGAGGSSTRAGGAGGGALLLNVSGQLALSGQVTSWGQSSTGSDGSNEGAGGAGGSVYVVTNVLSGAGNFSANGGSGGPGGANSGGGGGGRIAVYYQSAYGFSDFTASTALGGASPSGTAGQSGTVGFFDTSVSGYHFYLFKNFRYLTAGSSINYAAITMNNSAELDIAGNSSLNTTNLTVINSSIIVRGKYTSNTNGVGVNFSATNIRVDSNSRIYADALGYAGGTDGVGASGSGAGAGNWNGGGGAFGGNGGAGASGAGGSAYGSLTAPLDLGSGGAGGSSTRAGGAGAGAILLNVTGNFTLDGLISANGGNSTGSDCCNEGGGGSGGSIYVITSLLNGNGVFLANGGTGGPGGANSGGGGGGRIAVYYQNSSGFNGFTTSIASAGASPSGTAGQSGTVGFIDTTVSSYSLWIYQAFRYTSPGSSATWGALTLSNGGDLDIAGNSTLVVLGNLTINGSSTLNVRGNYTTNSNGRGVNMTIGNLTLASGSRILADAQGYAGGTDGVGAKGSGAGSGNWNGGGGAYGGSGGSGSSGAGGSSYGSNTAPLDLGSGGAGGSGARAGGAGGGAIFIRSSDQMVLNGNVTARGADSTGSDCCNEGAGGSGGAIYLYTNVLTGTGSVDVRGGNSPAGGANSGTGGGGRVAIYFVSNTSSGAVNVAAGQTGGGLGSSGTVYSQTIDATAPSVTLNSPTNASVSSSSSISFNATATDDAGLGSATLYSNFSGSWAANNSNASILSNNSPFLINVSGISQGYFLWNVKSCDNSSNCAYAASNRTLTVDTVAPTVPQLVSPALSNNSNTSASFIFVNTTFTESFPYNCLLSFNGSVNHSMTLGGSGSSRYCYYNVTSLTDAAHNYTVYVNDSAGRMASNGTFFVQVDGSSPGGFSYVSPTLANGSAVSVDWLYYNVTFTETNPDSCMLWVNGTAFAMARTGTNCYLNRTGLSSGTFDSFVQANDTLGNFANSSSRRLVVDRIAPSSFGLIAPTFNNSFTRLNYSLLNVSFTEANPDNCVLQYGNATALGNYSMTRSGTFCFFNVTSNFTNATSQTHNFTVFAIDAAGNVNSSGTYFVTHDSAAPSSLAFVSPTLSSGSTSLFNYVEVNVTFTESNPDSCLVEFNNGTLANYTMTRVGSSCFKNVTVSNNGNFNYTVWANDSAGNGAQSARGHVVLTDDASAPVVTLVSPADSAAFTSAPTFSFLASDDSPSAMSCVLYLDGSSAGINASVLNATSTVISSTVSISYAVHTWQIRCTDASDHQGNSSVLQFSLSSQSGSGAQAFTPTPTAAPTPTPTVTPSVAIVPSVSPTPQPTPVFDQEEKLDFEEPSPTPSTDASVQPSVLVSSGPSVQASVELFVEPPALTLRRTLTVEELPVASNADGTPPSAFSGQFVSTYAVFLKNEGTEVEKTVQITQHFAFMDFLGPSCADYPAGTFEPCPVKVAQGSAVVTWLFNNVEPGQEVKAEVKVPQKLGEKDVRELSTAKVIATSLHGSKAREVEITVGVQPKPASFDPTLPAIGVGVLVIGAGAFFFMRKRGGNGGTDGNGQPVT